MVQAMSVRKPWSVVEDIRLPWLERTWDRDELGIGCSRFWAVQQPVADSAADAENDSSNGSIILHGGGQISTQVLREFVELSGGKKARIVVIPSGIFVRGQRDDGEEFDESIEEFDARVRDFWPGWINMEERGLIESLDFLYTDNREDCERPEFVEKLRRATGVFVPAAYQGKLAWRFTHRYPDRWSETRDSRFQRELRAVVSRGGVVMGHGGGSSALADLMIKGGQTESGRPMEAEVQPGLGLIQGAIVDQNFDTVSGRLERLTNLLKDMNRLDAMVRWPATGRSMIGLGIEQETALVIQGDRLRVVGERTAHLFLKGNGDRTVWWTRIDAESGTYRIDRRSEGHGKVPPSNAQVQQEWSNPLGMPEPIDPRKVGAVVLHGGGANQDLIDVFPRLTHQSLPRLLHCPAADTEFQPLEGETAQEFRSRAGEYFDVWIEKEAKGECQDLKFLSCRTAEEAKRASFLEPIRKADGVWFSGGDQAELSRLFVDPEGVSPFEAALHEVVRRGGVVGGSSAGTAIMAKVMIVSTQENNTGPMRANIGKGLSLLRHAIIEQHLGGEGRAGRLERFTELLLNDAKVRSQMDEESQTDDKFGRDRSVPHRIGLAIEEETWIVIRGHQIEVFGKNRAHVFLVRPDRSQIAWHELVPGDRALLRSGPEGLELEFDEWSVARLDH